MELEKKKERIRVLKSRHNVKAGRRKKMYILRYDRRIIKKNHHCNIIVSLVSRRVSRTGGKHRGRVNTKRNARRERGRAGKGEKKLERSNYKLIEILNYCTKLSAGSS